MSDNATMKNTTIHDMTTGSPARLIMQFMIPMFLGNIFQQFYNIADSIIAGQFLGVRALAAIGSTGSLMFFVTGSFLLMPTAAKCFCSVTSNLLLLSTI